VTSPAPVRLVSVPYDSGHLDVRMGAGPRALSGVVPLLRARGHDVEQREVEPTSAWRAELQTAFELQREVATEVRAARAAGQVPLVLAGNCGTTVGVLAGLTEPGVGTGLVWLDAHADFNTPETDPGGFLDGQGLAMAVGRCWTTLTAGVPGFVALPEPAVVLVGARDVHDAEAVALERSAVTWLPPARARDGALVAEAVAALAARADQVHVHVDLDVLDPSVGRANGFAVDDGLLTDEVRRVVELVSARLPIVSATLASYDPGFDVDGAVRETALALLALLAGLARPASVGG